MLPIKHLEKITSERIKKKSKISRIASPAPCVWLKASEHPIPSSRAPVESVAHGGKLGPAYSFWISPQKFVFNQVPRTGTRKGDNYPMSAQKALGSPDQQLFLLLT